MNTQEKLNCSVIECVESLTKLLPNFITSFSVNDERDYIEVEINNPFDPNLPIRLITAGEEITFTFGETHFHIAEYTENIRIENLVEELAVHIVGIVSNTDKTYSAWKNATSLGGGLLTAKVNLENMQKDFPKANKFKVIAWNNQESY